MLVGGIGGKAALLVGEGGRGLYVFRRERGGRRGCDVRGFLLWTLICYESDAGSRPVQGGSVGGGAGRLQQGELEEVVC